MSLPKYPNTAILILAAGASSRLGRPKQLLPWKGKPLLRYLLDEAKTACPDYTWTVLGANAAQIQSECDLSDVQVVTNSKWKEGMGTSISVAVSTMLKHSPRLERIVILLGDQPFITASYIKCILEMQTKEKSSALAQRHPGGDGVPAIFTSIHFPGLLELSGEKGAKSLLQQIPNRTRFIMAYWCTDIDTEYDYEGAVAFDKLLPKKGIMR